MGLELMQKVTRQFIDHLIENTKIVEFMESEYDSNFLFNGKSNWANTNCPMPNHDDSSPSFGVNTADNLFHCFGCGVKGDIIKLVQLSEGLNFIESIQRLSDFSNIEIELVNLDVKFLLRELSQTFNKYFEVANKSKFPGGLGEISFMIAFAERTKKYLKQNNTQENFLWIESLYRQLEDYIDKEDYKSINVLWKNFSKMCKEK